MGWIKVCGQDGKIYLYSGITEPDEALNYLIENRKENPEMTDIMIETHKTKPLSVITGNEKIIFNKNIHGNL